METNLILENAKADIVTGGVIGIVGGNGEGKSSLLSVLANETIPTSGHLEWFGNMPTISYFKQEDEQFKKNDFAEDEWAYFSKWSVPEQRKYEDLSGGEKMKRHLSRVFAEKSHFFYWMSRPII